MVLPERLLYPALHRLAVGGYDQAWLQRDQPLDGSARLPQVGFGVAVPGTKVGEVVIEREQDALIAVEEAVCVGRVPGRVDRLEDVVARFHDFALGISSRRRRRSVLEYLRRRTATG